MFSVTETNSNGLVKEEYVSVGIPAIGVKFGDIVTSKCARSCIIS